MHRNRNRGGRDNRHRRSFEEMLDVVTSTPAGEGVRLGYQDYPEDTSDTYDDTYDPEEDGEAYYEYTYGDVEHTPEEQSKVK